MQVPVGKAAGGGGIALSATSYTTGTGALFLIVLVTVLLTLLVALSRFIPREQKLGGWSNALEEEDNKNSSASTGGALASDWPHRSYYVHHH